MLPVPSNEIGAHRGQPWVTVGVDVTPVDRIGRMIADNERALRRMLTPTECADCTDDRGRLDPSAVAGRIAAKEATFKALHRPGPVPWRHIAVRISAEGWPELDLPAELLGATGKRTSLSLSHDHGLAIAVVVVQRSDVIQRSDKEQHVPDD